MSDKKIIIAALLLSVLIIGGGWYYSKNRPPTASVAAPLAAAITTQGITIGNPAAPVTIEEYTNFLCPACASFAANAYKNITEDYVKTGQIKFVLYIYPPFELGRAALCANEQNKFAEYHDYLFAHQGEIDAEQKIKDFARAAGLNGDEFIQCYDGATFKDAPASWYQEGQARKVDATPTFFINGQKLVGAQPYAEFKKIIDEKLK